MQTLVLALLLSIILGGFSRAARLAVRRQLQLHPRLVFFLPAALTTLFSAAAAYAGVLGIPLTLLAALYAFLPVTVAWAKGAGPQKSPAAADFAVILMPWLPLEFGAGGHWVPRAAQGFLHSVAYGVAIVLALVLFTTFRTAPGLKYDLPRPHDMVLALAGFALTAPVLAVAGISLGFIPWPHAPLDSSAGFLIPRFLVILAGTGLPEEILFRSLIQNFLMQRFGATNATLLVSSLIFGAAHLNNGPQPLPNWRYMILATIAGYAYGKVFQKSSSVGASALFHAMVDATKHFFF